MAIYLLNLFSLLIWQAVYQKMPKTQKSKLFIMTLIFVQFVLIEGLRDFSVGADTAKYMLYYDRFSHETIMSMIENPQYVFEFGYMMLMYICRKLLIPTRGFLIIVTSLLNYLYFRFIYKESDNFILSLWIFICFEYFTLSFTMLRQMIAMGFVLNAFIYLKKDDYIKFLITMVLAVSFHKASIIFLVVPAVKFIYRMINEDGKLGKFLIMNRYLISVLALLMLMFLKPIIVSFALKLYPEYTSGTDSLGLLFIEIFGILILTMMCEHLTEKKTKLRYYQLFLLISVCIQYCTTIFFMINRVTLYFYVFSIVGIPYCIDLIKDVRVRRIVLVGTLFISFLQYYLVTMDMYNVVPYVLGKF